MFQRAMVYANRSDQTWISPAARTIPQQLLDEQLPDTPLEINPRNLESLAQTVAACKDRNIRLILFLSPYSPGAYGDRDIAGEYAAIIGKSVPDAPPVVDYTRAIDEPNAFADRMHTNARGAELLLDTMIADELFEQPNE